MTAMAKAVLERAIKTFAQTLAMLLIAGTTAVNVLHIDWQTDLGLAGGAALLSVLTSIGSNAITSAPGPSLTSAEQLVPTPPKDDPPQHAAP